MNLIRIAADFRLTAEIDGVQVEFIEDRENTGILRLLRRLAAADVVVMTLPSKLTALLCALAALPPSRTRVVYYDVNIPIPDRLWDRLKRRIYLELVRRADLVLTLQADTAEYARLLRLPQSRLRYVGFKSNAWEDAPYVRKAEESRDSGTYVLACGRSYRDFETFARAVAEAGLPARILLTQGSLEGEGSIPPSGDIPPNVELVQHDGTREGWKDALLGARIVVVPLRGDVIQPAGISVYLEAMNLLRPVIVTEGPATRGMLDDSIAGIVPARDSGAMAREAVRLWTDDGFRTARVAKARAYLERLGGVDRMSRDVLREAVSLIEGSQEVTQSGSASSENTEPKSRSRWRT
jgi:glycosyltransferase involved in cell wall biosynthesis